MKRTKRRSIRALCALLFLACPHFGLASPDGSTLGNDLLNELELNAGASVKAEVNNGKGVVNYQGKKVWEGRVRKDLKAIASHAADGSSKYAEGTELAAAWDGDKLVWENVKGAGLELEPQRLEMEKQRKKLQFPER